MPCVPIMLADVLLPGWFVAIAGVAALPALGGIVWLSRWIGSHERKSVPPSDHPPQWMRDHIADEHRELQGLHGKVDGLSLATVRMEGRIDNFDQRLSDHFASHHPPAKGK